jgi:hypothetical protein
MPLQIVTYRGRDYYVDWRLNQFRTVAKFPDAIEFIDFRSGKGDRILCFMMRRKLPIDWTLLRL